MATSNAMNTSNDRIKYTITVTQNSQNIANNTSNVTVSVRFYRTNTGYTSYGTGTVYCKINGTTYSAGVTPSQKITNSGIVLFTKTLNITHGDDGTKKLTCSAWISHDVVTSSEQSYTQTLTTIPRKSTLAVSNGTLGTKQTLTVTRKATSFTHTITWSCGSASGTIVTKSTDTTPDFTPPLSLASQNTNGTSVSVKFTITTYSGSTNIGSNSYTVTMSMPASVKPSCSIAVTDAAGYFDTYGAFIKGQSKLSVVITPVLAYGSAIASYGATVDGVKYSKANFTTGVLNSSGTLNISATVTDKRGRSGTDTESITVLDYSSPQISLIKVKRCVSLEDGTEDVGGEFAQVTFSAVITALNNRNSAHYSLEYKKASESWDDCISVELTDYAGAYTVTEGYYRFPADSGSSYNVRIVAVDNFTDDVKPVPLSTGGVMEHWRADGKGMGFGKVGEVEDGADFGWQIIPNAGFANIRLEANTNFDDLITPNTYMSYDKVASTYVNCPVKSGTFTLDVASGGNEGQIRQVVTYTSKTAFDIWIRFYYSGSWGDWALVFSAANRILWSGSYYMTADQSATLSEPVSKQPHGIILVFSRYAEGEEPYNWQAFFMPKYAVGGLNGSGHNFALSSQNFAVVGSKYLYIRDGYIGGNAANDASGTAGSGITYNNKAFVLSYVIGV